MRNRWFLATTAFAFAVVCWLGATNAAWCQSAPSGQDGPGTPDAARPSDDCPAPPTCPAPAAGELQRRFTLDQLMEIVRAEGYGSPEIIGTSGVKFRYQGSIVGLLIMEDGDLQMYYSIRGPKATTEQMNEWNKIKRLSRAYLDKDNDPTLEADLFLDAGVKRETVRLFIKFFLMSLTQFNKHIGVN